MNNTELTHGLWAVTAPDPPGTRPLDGENKADVVIIGGGYTGLSAALHLAESGTDALVLEAKTIGYGGAGRNVGLVNAGLWLMPDDVPKLVGREHGEQLISILGKSPDLVYGLVEKHGMECEAVRNGTLHCADSSAGLKALMQREEQWQRRGEPVTLLKAEEAALLIGSTAFKGALLDKRAGTVQPLAYARGLAGAALKAGARIHTESPVTGLTRTGSRWKVTTARGMVMAQTVLVATHGYSEFAFKHQEKAIVPFNFFQFSTPPLPEEVRKTILPQRHGAWDTNLILASYRMDKDGRLIVGSVGNLEPGGFAIQKAWTQRTIAKSFPQVGPVNLEHGWYGCIAMTTNHIPRFHVMDKNLFMVTSYNGRGIGPGTVFGKLLARYALSGDEKEIPLPLTPFKPIPFRWLRGAFYETGSRLYHFIQRRI